MALSEPTKKQKVWGRIFISIFALWSIFISLACQNIAWSASILGFTPETLNITVWASLVQGILLGVPLLLFVLLWRTPRYKSVFQTWLGASGFVLALAYTRLFISTQSQLLIAAQIGCMVLYLSLILWISRKRRRALLTTADTPTNTNMDSSTLVALVIAPISGYPWLAGGAVGTPLDIVLNLVAALLFGLIASILISHYWIRSILLDRRGPGRDIFTGGLVIGVTLLIMSSALSFNGVQILLMVLLPALGWLLMALSSVGSPHATERNLRGLSWLIGLAVAFPLILIDTDGILLEAQDGILIWAFRSVGIAILIAWLLGGVALLARNTLPRMTPNLLMLNSIAATWLLGGLIYVTQGQPGLYGDALFVILKDQADLSGVANIEDYGERRQFVYTSLVIHAEETQQNLRAGLDRFSVRYTPYYLVNGLEVRGGLIHRLWLNSRPEVDRVIPSPILRPLSAPVKIPSGVEEMPTEPQWNLTSIGAVQVWEEFGVMGAGVVVGQSDSGVQYDHPELIASYRGRGGWHDYNWFDPWLATRQPTDSSGHGTHTLGSILGKNVGVAPGASWYACANLSRNLGNPAFYLDCMQFMLAPFPRGGDPFHDGDTSLSAHVLNNSWGCPEHAEGCDAGSLQPAVQALRAAGIFTVASAGNSGPACSTVDSAISIYDEVFSVGAVDESGNLAPFSSVGPVTVDGSDRVKPDIVAPGVEVLSAYPNNTYELAGGTSMAGPHVAGVVALVWSANPDLMGNIERTEEILIESVRPFTGTVGSLVEMEIGDMAEVDPQENVENEDDELPPFVDFLLGGSAENSCLAQTDLAVIPNNVAGYGIVDAYRAVEMALNER